MKAKYMGECQMCGRVQKLPKGMLSQHGYAVRWNHFSGVCCGSRQQPYEESCELIKELIPGIVRDIKGFENMIMYLNNPLPGCDESYTQILDGDCYVYVKGKIIMEESEPSELLKGGTFKSFEFEYAINGATKRKGLLLLKRSCKNVNDVVVELNQTYINRVAQPALEMNQKYLTWCERRVREWVEKPLTPVME